MNKAQQLQDMRTALEGPAIFNRLLDAVPVSGARKVMFNADEEPGSWLLDLDYGPRAEFHVPTLEGMVEEALPEMEVCSSDVEVAAEPSGEHVAVYGWRVTIRFRSRIEDEEAA